MKEDVMFRTLSRSTVVALLLAVGPALVAQDRQREFESRALPGLTFTPSVSVGGVWDSNVAVAGNRGFGQETARDSLFILEPQGQLEFRDNRTEFIGGYKGYVRRYFDIEQLNGFDQRFSASLQRLATKRINFLVSNDYADMPTTDEVQLNGVPYVRTGSKSNRLSGAVEMRLTKYDDLAVRYENTWVSFDAESTFLRGGIMNEGRAEYLRRLSERLKLGGEYRVRHAELNGAAVMWFHDVGGAIEYALGPHLTVRGASGYSMLRDPRVTEEGSGPYVRGELRHGTERITSGIFFERSLAPSFGFGGASKSHEVRGYVHMPFSRNRFYLQSSGSWRRTDPLALLAELDLDTFLVDTTVGYSTSRWLRLEGFHVYTRQDSRFTGGEINRHRIGAQLVISQPMRIR